MEQAQWDGFPPKRDDLGWHLIRWTNESKSEPRYWDGEYWIGQNRVDQSCEWAARNWRYVGPLCTAEQVAAREHAAELRGFEEAVEHLFQHGGSGCDCQAHLEAELAQRKGHAA